MQKLTDKIGMLAKAVEDADLKGVKNFASDMKKLGVPLEHAPQISELLKLASFNYEDMKMFSSIIEEKLFRVEVNRDKALTYKTEECQLTAVEEVLVDQDAEGHVSRKICRVRVFFLSFLTGMPMVELGVNDMTRIGKEVVGGHLGLSPDKKKLREMKFAQHPIRACTRFLVSARGAVNVPRHTAHSHRGTPSGGGRGRRRAQAQAQVLAQVLAIAQVLAQGQEHSSQGVPRLQLDNNRHPNAHTPCACCIAWAQRRPRAS